MRTVLGLLPLALTLTLSPAAGAGATASAVVTSIHIDKQAHTLELLSGDLVVARYKAAIGPGGHGPKRFEGDRRTPVGRYHVVGRIPGLFHNFLTVSYPNDADRRRYAELKARGEVPPGRSVGFGIGIHGGGTESDWTLGCVALSNDDIDAVVRRVRAGTPIVITDGPDD